MDLKKNQVRLIVEHFLMMVNLPLQIGTLLWVRVIEVVNSQSTYNTDGTINAIPIIIWHRIDNSGEGDPEQYATTIDLFEKEIKYLHDNGFKVLTMADLGYDENSNYLYLKK